METVFGFTFYQHILFISVNNREIFRAAFKSAEKSRELRYCRTIGSSDENENEIKMNRGTLSKKKAREIKAKL